MKIPFSIKLGLLFGIMNCAIWYMVAKYMGFYSIEVYVTRNFVSLFLLIIGIFIAAFVTRKSNNGFMEFKEALKTGMVYSLIMAITLGIFNYLYYHIITPDTIDYFLSEAKNAAEAHGLKDEALQQFLERERSNFNSFKLIPPVLFFGLIISLLAGAVFQRKDPNAVEEA